MIAVGIGGRGQTMLRVIAIDWSGDRRKARGKIWLAEATGGQLVRLENGRNRREVVSWLIAESTDTPAMVIGLDFAFSFPAWHVRACGCSTVRELWAAATANGEDWLRCCSSPLWGRVGHQRPVLHEHFRKTELEASAVGGIRPKSVFQIGGAGAVGTGSVRGMVALDQLSEAGFAVWPFDPPRLPVVIEIYPRLLTGEVVKSSLTDRRKYLDERYPDLAPNVRLIAESCEDSFDAAVSTLVMFRHLDEILRLPVAKNDEHRLEGTIWCPSLLTPDS